MSTRPEADLTLPSLNTALPGQDREQRLVLTIIFHPDTQRIGEWAQVSTTVQPWVLGRRSPAFARTADSIAVPLEDPHISRQALALDSEGGRLTLRRLPCATCRCRVGGRELSDPVELSQQQLLHGVPILLGHSVVLLLRLAPWAEVVAPPGEMDELHGSSVYMVRLREQLGALARAGLDVLVRGETGTGKELVAAAIHRASERRDRGMVSVNMAAVPAGLAAATLFGNVRGAYTGAAHSSEGYFRQAQGGTLFMDEVGDTPAEVQPQLLRALQEREIQAVGGTITKVDVRVISATDAALEGEGCDFKAALRYRLGASEISLLPLREHPEDIGELLLHFLTINCRQQGHEDVLPDGSTSARDIALWADLFHRFLLYDWPGNVRELANFAGQVAVASTREATLPDPVRAALRGCADSPPAKLAAVPRPQHRKVRDIFEMEFDKALQDCGYEVANTARRLGVSRQSVYRRMKESSRYRLAGQVPLQELEQALAQWGGDASAVATELKVSLSSLRSRLRDSGLAWF